MPIKFTPVSDNYEKQQTYKELINKYVTLMESESNNLLRLSITDCLTSTYNHKYMYEYFEKKVLERISLMTILFCDIDHFKRINDTYGHITGDLVLQEVSKIIRESTNENEGIFRYGGEEFVILLENCSGEEGFDIAEKIRLKVCNSDIIKSYCNFEILTISIGLAVYPYDGVNIDTLIHNADTDMYHVKETGRNRCEIYNSEIMNGKKSGWTQEWSEMMRKEDQQEKKFHKKINGSGKVLDNFRNPER